MFHDDINTGLLQGIFSIIEREREQIKNQLASKEPFQRNQQQVYIYINEVQSIYPKNKLYVFTVILTNLDEI